MEFLFLNACRILLHKKSEKVRNHLTRTRLIFQFLTQSNCFCYHFPPYYQTEPSDLLIYMVKHLDHTKQYNIEREDMLNIMNEMK